MKKYKKIYIEITNNCNLNCSFCSEVKKPRMNMTLDEFDLILNKIKGFTDYIYLHVKGEPLVHKDIIEFINKANEYDLKVNLTTNGTLFNKYAKELGKCKNLKKINFSLHCEHNKDNYLEDIFDNIKYLSKDTTVIYRLWTLKDNKLDEKSTKIVDKIKDYYNLSTETVNKIKNENNVKISSTIYVDKDNEFIWPTVNNYRSNGYCYGLNTHIAILVDGTVVPCCLDSNGVIDLGNIYKDNLEDIINSDRYQNLLKSFRDRKPCEELCKSCIFKERF
ncbi:MAG: SPASM domain-containing protein [Bacilli bacterium]|nr:SPASM domain-containing protein [Bacilli bacterium]